MQNNALQPEQPTRAIYPVTLWHFSIFIGIIINKALSTLSLVTMSINLLESEYRLNLYQNPHSFLNPNLNLYSNESEFKSKIWDSVQVYSSLIVLEEINNAKLCTSSGHRKGDHESLWEIIHDIKVLFPLFYIQHHNTAHYSWYIYPLVALIHFLTSSVIQKHFYCLFCPPT